MDDREKAEFMLGQLEPILDEFGWVLAIDTTGSGEAPVRGLMIGEIGYVGRVVPEWWDVMVKNDERDYRSKGGSG